MATTSDSENLRTAEHRYAFDIPSRGLSVVLDSAVVDGVVEEVLKGFGALPRRGAEIGGLLLGRESVLGNKTIIVVEAFDPIPIEYLSGPSYHLSEADRRNLDQRLGMWRHSPEHRLWVVGLYRSHTRKDFELDEQDMTTCSQVLTDRPGLFLLIKPTFTRPPTAGIFFWHNGVLERSAECPDFTLESGTAFPPRAPSAAPSRPRSAAASAGASLVSPSPPNGGDQRAALEDTVEPSAVRPSASARGDWASRVLQSAAVREAVDKPDRIPVEPPPEIVPPPPEMPWRSWALTATAALAILAGGWHFLGLQSEPVRMPAPTLDLVAGENQGQLEIEWNRAAPIALTATRGVLTITDGPIKKDMEFNGEQVRTTKKVLYTRLTGEVGLRFEVFAADRSQSESIRSVKPGWVPAAPASGGTGSAGREPALSGAATGSPPARQAMRGAVRRLAPQPAGTAAPLNQTPQPQFARPAPVRHAVQPPQRVPQQETAPPVVSDTKPAPVETKERPREIPKPGRRR